MAKKKHDEITGKPFTADEHSEIAKRLAEMTAWFQDLAKQLKKRYGKDVFGPPHSAERAAEDVTHFGRVMRFQREKTWRVVPPAKPAPIRNTRTN